jgi:expansin (peptidoglycan-binding protein)
MTPPHPRRRLRPALVSAVSAALLAAVAGCAGPSPTASTGSAPVASTQATVPPGAESPTPAADANVTPSPPSATTPAPARQAAAKTSPATEAQLAGRIRPKVTYRGDATHYDAGDGNGACLYGPSSDLMIAAMNHTDYESAKACGAHILVRADNGASVKVLITNECPLPCAPGQIDLSREAFAKLADLSAGRIAITWRLLSPDTSDTISIRYKTGSSQWWCAIQAIGHRNPVARLEVRTGNRWQRLPRTGYNHFISEDGSGCGGAIRITDIYGQRLVVNGIAVKPDVVQPTQVQFAKR